MSISDIDIMDERTRRMLRLFLEECLDAGDELLYILGQIEDILEDMENVRTSAARGALSDTVDDYVENFYQETDVLRENEPDFIEELDGFCDFINGDLYESIDVFISTVKSIEIADSLPDVYRNIFSEDEYRILNGYYVSNNIKGLENCLLDYFIEATTLTRIRSFMDHFYSAVKFLIDDASLDVILGAQVFWEKSAEAIIPIAGIPASISGCEIRLSKKLLGCDKFEERGSIPLSSGYKVLTDENHHYLKKYYFSQPIGDFIFYFRWPGWPKTCIVDDIKISPLNNITHPLLYPQEFHLGRLGSYLIYDDGEHVSVGYLPKYLLDYFRPVDENLLVFDHPCDLLVVSPDNIYVFSKCSSGFKLDFSFRNVSVDTDSFSFILDGYFGSFKRCDDMISLGQQLVAMAKKGHTIISTEKSTETYIDFS